ncbi:MAG: secondary thiamine-phosphate synthase enzyme [Candidatus Paceibacteria bacterium]
MLKSDKRAMQFPESAGTKPTAHARLFCMLLQHDLKRFAPSRGTYELTREVADLVCSSGIRTGLCTVFVHHTSASLILCENADPTVREDLEAWLARAIPDGDRIFVHTAEGPDDMPAHVRTCLTSTSVGIPVRNGELDLGTWQGVYLYEHRLSGSTRRVSVTILGE